MNEQENKQDETETGDTPEEKSEAEETEAVEPEVVEEEIIEEVDETTRLQDEVANLKDEMVRVRADSENFRKRLNKEKSDAIQYANEKLIKALMPIYADLERALEAPDANAESIKEGVRLISQQFMALLKKENVEPIPAVGEKFDPNHHEVLTQIESADHDEGTVIEEYIKGYLINGRVLLPSKVAIAKKPVAPVSNDSKDTPPDNESEETEIKA